MLGSLSLIKHHRANKEQHTLTCISGLSINGDPGANIVRRDFSRPIKNLEDDNHDQIRFLQTLSLNVFFFNSTGILVNIDSLEYMKMKVCIYNYILVDKIQNMHISSSTCKNLASVINSIQKLKHISNPDTLIVQGQLGFCGHFVFIL